MFFASNDILVLLGAGASKEAGIPTSEDMIKNIEEVISNDNNWKDYADLYNVIKSSIHYADGLAGKFGGAVYYNIERFVYTLSELEKREEHTIFPFVGSWSGKLVEVAGRQFQRLTTFREMILRRLKEEWLSIEDYGQASYYAGVQRFKNEFTYPLRVFSLNYDVCLERNLTLTVERGFDEARLWDWRRFDDAYSSVADLYLYKLHGSMDWKRDSQGRLTYVDDSIKIALQELQIIFGTNYKLQYLDPFLFMVYELRKYSLDAKLIVCVGYGFADDHVNGILGQALRASPTRIILAVGPCDTTPDQERQRIATAIGASSLAQIAFLPAKAKEFFETRMTMHTLSEQYASLIPGNGPF